MHTFVLTPKSKVWIAILINVSILSILSIFLHFSSIQTAYYTYGPNDTLLLFGVKINTVAKYILLHLFIFISEISEVFISEIAMPYIDFNVYNPDKRVITEFSRSELHFFANMLYTLNSLKKLFLLIVSISQFDIALSKVFYSEISRVYAIHFILSEKKFHEYELI